jgi:hypothetical protein
LKRKKEGNRSINPRWLCVREACQYASMSWRKMKRHIEAGEIFAKKSGKWFVDRESIDTFFLDDSYENMMVEKLLAEFR